MPHKNTDPQLLQAIVCVKRACLLVPKSIHILDICASVVKPDFEKFPKAKKVKFYDLTVHPGSVLFVPPYWWHQVSSVSTSISVSIWCKTGLLKAEWGALQLLPTHIKYFTKQIFLAKRH
jgi:ectoine hydroxylase-related dioxygenase (phytanoyl-CoA dioxygenase family)